MDDKINMINSGFADFESIEGVLMPDEKILWRAKPDKKVYVLEAFTKMLPIAIIWLLLDGGFLTAMTVTGIFKTMPKFMIFILIPFFIVHLAPVWIWIGMTIRSGKMHKNIEYVATNKRFITKSGLRNIDIRTIDFADVSSLLPHRGRLDKMYGVGDIIITGAKVNLAMVDIPNPAESYNLLKNMVSELGDIAFPSDNPDAVTVKGDKLDF